MGKINLMQFIPRKVEGIKIIITLRGKLYGCDK